MGWQENGVAGEWDGRRTGWQENGVAGGWGGRRMEWQEDGVVGGWGGRRTEWQEDGVAGSWGGRRMGWQEDGVAGSWGGRRMGWQDHGVAGSWGGRSRGALPPHRGSEARQCGSGRDGIGVPSTTRHPSKSWDPGAQGAGVRDGRATNDTSRDGMKELLRAAGSGYPCWAG